MTEAEILRMFCYVVASVAGMRLLLYHLRTGDYGHALLFGSMTALFTWYIVEITIASTGINTREYRVIGTPMVIAMTVALVKLAAMTHAHRARSVR